MHEAVFNVVTAARRSSCKSLSQSDEVGWHDWMIRPAWYLSLYPLPYTHCDKYEARPSSNLTPSFLNIDQISNYYYFTRIRHRLARGPHRTYGPQYAGWPAGRTGTFDYGDDFMMNIQLFSFMDSLARGPHRT